MTEGDTNGGKGADATDFDVPRNMSGNVEPQREAAQPLQPLQPVAYGAKNDAPSTVAANGMSANVQVPEVKPVEPVSVAGSAQAGPDLTKPVSSAAAGPAPITPALTGMGSGNQMAATGFGTANNPMMANPNAMPIGSNDIILQNNKGKKSRKWWIIGGVTGALVLVLIVVGLAMRGGGSGAKASDLRSAFNIYANYFLTGEAKDEDLPETVVEDEADEGELLDEVEEETVEEVTDEIEVVDEATEEGFTVEDGVITDEAENNSYFYKNIASEDSAEYREKIKAYFETFYEFYVDEMQDDEAAMELIDEYRNAFDFVMVYYDNETLDENKMFEMYTSEGSDAVSEYVATVTRPFENLNAINEVNIHSLMVSYGQSELKMIQKFDALGCLVDNDVDYDCLENSGNTEYEQLIIDASDYGWDLMTALENSEADLYIDISSLNNVIRNAENEDDSVEVDDEGL